MAYDFQKSYLILLTFGKRDDFPDRSSCKTPGARQDPTYFKCGIWSTLTAYIS